MISSEVRANARESLRGKWGKAALLTLVYALIVYAISWVCAFIPVIGSLANIVVTVPLTYGIVVSFIKLKRNEEVGYVDFCTIGFSSFSKIWSVTLNTALKMIVPIILMIVFLVVIIFSTAGAIFSFNYTESALSYSAASGFGTVAIICSLGIMITSIYAAVKGLLYSLNNYILFDNPNMSGKEVVEQSEKLMRGNRARLFWLQLSFIGWAILASFTFGIGMFWLMPYMMVAIVVFYEDLAGSISSANKEEAKEIEDPQDNPIQGN